MQSRHLALIIIFIAIALGIYTQFPSHSTANAKNPDKISYNFHIRPIFSDKCFKCHGPDIARQKGSLRLDLQETAYAELKENPGHYAIVPGDPERSEVYLRISNSDTAQIMPPADAHLGSLTPAEIQLVKKWIQQGAQYEPHWAFLPPTKSPLPDIVHKNFPKNEIDYFTGQKMEAAGLSPNPEATKEQLLKRASLDITGLPPSLELMDRFEADESPNAYENLLDYLLAQPQFGEKMAVHWLDVARYSDSYGYQDDNIRTQWPWRDWVIHAFNENMPYDQFLTWQIAGDMQPNATKEQILATGFFRNHKYTEEGGVIDEEYRVEYLIDKTKTFSKGILGVTVECAQCHDHKYDPFTQKDYFSLLAFFNNTKEVGFEGDVSQSKPAKNPIMVISDADVKGILNFLNKKDTAPVMVSVMGELDTLRQTHLLKRGLYSAPDVVVPPQALPAVMPFDTHIFEPNRRGLAAWTVDSKNPLTARVFVNQIWQEIFGRGIVKTTGDFGMQGELPSHPELLDWLAVDFMENGWNIKRLIKQIMLSATYRQSAKITDTAYNKDPENVWLSRAPRLRLKAEFIRDMYLATSGLLQKEIGGPSTKPYQPKGLWEGATSGRGALATYKQDHGNALYRRGIYTFIKLTVPPPVMRVFDASNRDQCEVKRLKTNTPLQALAMMNDPGVLEASRVLAQNTVKKDQPLGDKLALVFKQIIGRKILTEENDILNKYYQEQLTLFQNNTLDAQKTLQIGEYPQNYSAPKAETAALMKTIALIYNMEEAITKS